jgi:hypothetical protein
MNGPAGATVAGCDVTPSSGARRSVARSWCSLVAPPSTHATHKKWELGTYSSSHPRVREPQEDSTSASARLRRDTRLQRQAMRQVLHALFE